MFFLTPKELSPRWYIHTIRTKKLLFVPIIDSVLLIGYTKKDIPDAQISAPTPSVTPLSGKYYGDGRSEVKLPNSEIRSIFNGTDAYFEISDNKELEVISTDILTIETWIRTAAHDFPVFENGYVHWMDKGIKKSYKNRTLRRQGALSGYNIIPANTSAPKRVLRSQKTHILKGL